MFIFHTHLISTIEMIIAIPDFLGKRKMKNNGNVPAYSRTPASRFSLCFIDVSAQARPAR